jgi:YhcH/YjgK/YiaL family protein
MILNRIDRITTALPVQIHDPILNFLAQIKSHPVEGNFPILDEKIHASVFKKLTAPFEEARLEAHRAFADIHFLLSGKEKIGWYQMKGLEIETPYDMEKDLFFLKKTRHPDAEIIMDTDLFVLFFPEEIHMPLLIADEKPSLVLKGVIKISMTLFG